MGLDRSLALFSVHVSQLLFLPKHAFFILRNLLLIARDVIPIYLTRALVHRVLIQALCLLARDVIYLAHHDFRLIFVPVVERSCQILAVDRRAG